MDSSSPLLIQLPDPDHRLTSQIPISLHLYPIIRSKTEKIVNFTVSMTIFRGKNGKLEGISVLPRADRVLEAEEWRELMGNGRITQGSLFNGAFYMLKQGNWKQISLKLVFIDPIIATYYSQIHRKMPDFAFLALENIEIEANLQVLTGSNVEIGQEIRTISSPFGLLGPEIYANSVTQGVISMLLEGNIAVLDARVMPGCAGGTVFNHDFTAILGVLVPVFQETHPFVLMYPLYTGIQVRESRLWLGIRSVVSIKGRNVTGSGVIISQNEIITNKHVVGDCSTVTVRVQNRSYTGTVSAVGRVLDVAVVKLRESVGGNAINKAKEMRVSERIYAIGYGNLVSTELPLVTSGTLSKLVYHKEELIAVQSSAYVMDGQSGGALVNAQGEFIGLLTSTVKLDDQPLRSLGLSISLPALHNKPLWKCQDQWLSDIFAYQNVEDLPRFRGKL